jgi:hypothetical protein
MPEAVTLLIETSGMSLPISLLSTVPTRSR